MEVDFRLIPKYINKMGLVNGGRAFLYAEVLKLNEWYFHPLKRHINIRPGSSDAKVFREVFLFEDYQVNLTQPPKVIIDGGANIGLSAIYFSNRYPDAKIIAVEPDSENFQVLKKNVTGYPNIVPLNSALWYKSTWLKIRNSSDDEWAFQVIECEQGNEGSFLAVSIDELMQQYEIEKIDLLKLDIEGSEKEIFEKGYEHWLNKTNMIVIELHDWIKKGVSRSVFRTISNFNFRTVVKGDLIIQNFN